jgi:hypothetical protein
MRWMGARIVPDRLNRRAAELLSTTVRTPTLIVKVGQKRTIYVSFRKATDSRRHFHCLEETSMTIFLHRHQILWHQTRYVVCINHVPRKSR